MSGTPDDPTDGKPEFDNPEDGVLVPADAVDTLVATAEFVPPTFHEKPYTGAPSGTSIDDRTAGWGKTWRFPPLAIAAGVRSFLMINVSLPDDYIFPTTIGIRCDGPPLTTFRIEWGSGGANHIADRPTGTYYVGATRVKVSWFTDIGGTAHVSAWLPTVPNNV